MKKNNIVRQLLFYLVAILLIVGAVSVLSSRGTQKEKPTYDDIIRYFQNEQVREVVVTPKNVLEMVVEVEEGKTARVSYKLRDDQQFFSGLEPLIQEQIKSGKITTYEPQPNPEYSAWLSFLPLILILVGLIALWIFSANAMKNGGGKFNSFGKAKVKTPGQNTPKVLFRDVAGADEEKEELVEVVEFLKDPALHLIRSLVGECHRQDMPVRIPVLALQQEFYVFSGKPVCLSRAGRSLHYL